MDCSKVSRMLQDQIDGRLAPSAAASVRDHLASCGPCSAEAASLRRVGDALRMWAAARTAEMEPRLDLLWPRVRAGIAERKRRETAAARLLRWLWLPAAAVAVLVLVFYPSDMNRTPFHPANFHVAVEDLESDTATVALVDRGEDLPRVIWIIEDDRT